MGAVQVTQRGCRARETREGLPRPNARDLSHLGVRHLEEGALRVVAGHKVRNDALVLFVHPAEFPESISSFHRKESQEQAIDFFLHKAPQET